MKKRIMLSLLAVLSILSVTACNKATEINGTLSDSSEPSTELSAELTSAASTPEKWTGEDVLIKEYTPGNLTQQQTEALEELRAKIPDGTLIYQEQIIYGQAKPGMRKITVEEAREIVSRIKTEVENETAGKTKTDFKNLAFYAQDVSDKILKEIQEIQFFPDQRWGEGDIYYFFWPDSDDYEQRRTAITFRWSPPCSVSIATYDENNHVANEEMLFDLYPILEEIKERS